MANIAEIVNNLQQERVRAAQELEQLDQAIAALDSLNDGIKAATSERVNHPRRTVSAAARRRMAAAQRARWAKAKSGSTQPNSTRPGKRVMSIASRKKIAAAKRAWWAKQKRAA